MLTTRELTDEELRVLRRLVREALVENHFPMSYKLEDDERQEWRR